MDGSSLGPVLPSASGKGFPYAPVDWPNPGDVWTWKVGNKIGPSGYYLHRFLIVPERLQKSPTRKVWLGSKPSIIRYLQSEFPQADIEAFFASFTWHIPAEMGSMRKAESKGSSRKAIPTNGAERRSHIFKRTRNSTKKLINLTDNENDGTFDTNVAIYPSQDAPEQFAFTSKPQDSNSLADHLAEMTSEDFDIYLSSLDDILYPSLSTEPPNVLQVEDFTKAREELSSLLAMDFPSLIASNKLPQVTKLSSNLQSDPNLTAGELCMLNLIQEIPLASSHFLDAKQATAEVNKLFQDLEANIGRVRELKSEYMISKDKIALLQAEDASASSTIQEIDEQIAILQKRRAILAEVVKRNQRKIAELASTQRMSHESVPKIVNEVQRAISERSEWEMKKKEAAKQEANILAKFAPLEGFSFVR